MVAVLAGQQSDHDVLFATGLAVGLRKPVLLCATQTAAVPPRLHALPLVRLAPGADESLVLALRHVPTDRPRPGWEEDDEEQVAAPLGRRADAVLIALATASSEREILDVLASAITAPGLMVLQEGEVGEDRFDLGVWAAEFTLAAGNPFLIQVKRTLADARAAEQAAQQVTTYLSALGGVWGMVVYLDGPPSETYRDELAHRSVLILRADEFVEALRHASFPEVVRDLRNRRTHELRLV
jgi:hypothetical protein